MDQVQYAQHVRDASVALAVAAAAAPDAPVAACPGWDRRTVVRHVSRAHGWVRAQLAAGPGEVKSFKDAERAPEGDELYEWFVAAAGALADGLASMDTAATWPTFAGPRPGLWFPRRMAQETAMHRWDLDPAPIDADLAADGLDELLTVLLPLVPKDPFAASPGTIHLHATDEDLATPCEWLLTMGADGIVAEPVHAKGDVALRGPASDLLLWAWNRIPADRLDVRGDAALAERWATLVSL